MSSVILCSNIFLTGCSVKEERSKCPCLLVLDFREDTALVRGPVRVSFMADDFSLTDSMAIAAEREYKVPRRQSLRMSAMYVEKSPEDDFSISDQGVIIPLGSQSPELYLFYREFSSDVEDCAVSVDMKKNFCRLKIRLVACESLSNSEFYVKGNTCGSAFNATALAGDFNCKADFNPSGVATVNLPRQRDDSMVLQTRSSEGVVQSFYIGKYIEKTGYDWNAEELEDVEILIDYAQADITVKVAQWEKVFSFDIVI